MHEIFKQTVTTAGKALKILVILIVLILVVVKACDMLGFSGDQASAMKIAKQIQQSCNKHHMCPTSLSALQPHSNDSNSTDQKPKFFEYRLTASKQQFVVTYKGTFDPDCGSAIYGGVGIEMNEATLCETPAWDSLRNTYRPTE